MIFRFSLHVCSKNGKIQGSGVPKSMKNPPKINAKIMPKNVMQKGRKMEPKWVQNGSQNRTKIGKRWKKGGPEIDAKKRCKFEGRKVASSRLKSPKHSTLGLRRLGFGAPGGLGGTVKPDFDSDVI